MQPVRLIVEDAPPSLAVPEEMRHRRLEVIFWPLSNVDKPGKMETAREKLARILAAPATKQLRAISIDTAGFHFDRDEANER